MQREDSQSHRLRLGLSRTMARAGDRANEEREAMKKDIEERARQFLADQILNMATRIQHNSGVMADARNHFELSPNPARDVELAAAAMGAHLAKLMSQGHIPLTMAVTKTKKVEK